MDVTVITAMTTHITTVIKLLTRGALPEHSTIKGEEKLPDLPSDDTNWTCMNEQ